MRREQPCARVALALALAVAMLLVACKRGAPAPPPPATRATLSADAIVVGAGIAGLSAAWELARGGATVVVLDMASIPGGHAVMATGDLCIVGTPMQEASGVHDTPELATQDFLTWGEDANADWVRTYATTSRREIYDWVTEMGVTFETLVNPPGNSVRRTHRTRGRGLALVSAVYASCGEQHGIRFLFNNRVDGLLTQAGRVTGVSTTNVRTSETLEAKSRVVVLATGGFQSNLDMVRENWPSGMPFPSRLLIGSGINSVGLGHKLAQAAGAALTRLDHQWNYITGLPDPRDPDARRGLNAYAMDSVWVNAEGKRFMAERSSTKFGMPLVLKQPGSTYWSVFDEAAKKSFWVAGSDWGDFSVIDRVIFGDRNLMKSAATLADLATQIGLPASALAQTVERYNRLAATGVDEDFGRFGPGKTYQPKKIGSPPYYAAQFFPLTRKSLGGVAIDTSCHVLDAGQQVIGGLYAAGELTGLAGINGKAGLEGTFLGPSIVTGRIAGRAALEELGRKPGPQNATLPQRLEPLTPSPEARTERCLSCHDLPALVTQARPGYWHFEKAHTKVLAEKRDCVQCHAELSPAFLPEGHRIDHRRQIQVCPVCHKGEDR